MLSKEDCELISKIVEEWHREYSYPNCREEASRIDTILSKIGCEQLPDWAPNDYFNRVLRQEEWERAWALEKKGVEDARFKKAYNGYFD